MTSTAGTLELRERLDRARERTLAWFLVTFLFWAFAQITLTLLFLFMLGQHTLPAWLFGPFALLPLLLSLVFLGAYLRVMQRIRADRATAEALNDELVRYAWLRAAAARSLLTRILLRAFSGGSLKELTTRRLPKKMATSAPGRDRDSTNPRSMRSPVSTTPTTRSW